MSVMIVCRGDGIIQLRSRRALLLVHVFISCKPAATMVMYPAIFPLRCNRPELNKANMKAAVFFLRFRSLFRS